MPCKGGGGLSVWSVGALVEHVVYERGGIVGFIQVKVDRFVRGFLVGGCG